MHHGDGHRRSTGCCIGGEWVPGVGGCVRRSSTRRPRRCSARRPRRTRRRRRGRRARPRATRCRAGSARAPRSGPTCSQALAERDPASATTTLLPLIMAETGATLVGGLRAAGAPGRRPLRALRRRARCRTSRIPLPPSVMPTTPLAAGWPHRRRGEAPAGRRRRVHLAVQLPAHEHGRARSAPRSRPATRS